ncbi:MAG: arylamine N-acetyltransferase [Croceibacterium sp.]
MDRAPGADPSGLAAIVAAHRLAIPFENLDIPLRRGIRIDPPSIAAKLLDARRGGYCFEQNGLLLSALQAFGFIGRPLLARVRLGLPNDATPPRSHVLLLLELAGELWIADAGFGGSFVPPMPLRDGFAAVTADGAEHRLERRGERGSAEGEWLLLRRGPLATTDGRADQDREWVAQYSFDLAQVAPDDLEQANHWTATRPGMRFTSNVVASMVLPDGFISLTGHALSIARAGQMTREELETAEEMRGGLARNFGIVLEAEDVAALHAFAAG